MKILPLTGRRILVARPKKQAGGLAQALSALGAEVLHLPLIDIRPPEDWSPVDAALARLPEFDWILFTSANGVAGLLDRMSELGRPPSEITARVAAVGEATAEAAHAHGLAVHLVAGKAVAEGLVEALATTANLENTRMLWPRGDRGRDTLRLELERRGAHVLPVVVYRTLAAEVDAEGLRAIIRAGAVHWIALTSPSAAHSLYALLGELVESDAWQRVRLASIGPVTSRALLELGRPADVEGPSPSADALAAAIADFELQQRGQHP
ncbi:uroporphyrinogen-III synthase [bacterium]|nr:uroporphyrinogen-III synthase [bacterium]